MTITSPREGLRPSIRVRGAGYSAIRDCLRAQASAPAQAVWARGLGVDPLAVEAGPAYDTALGQISVARELAGLGPGWSVLHSVPIDDGEIDHLVIGPAGVFAIVTRRFEDSAVVLAGNSFTVDGERGPHLPGIQALARRASEQLSWAAGRYVPVTPVVAVVDARSIATARPTPIIPVRSSHTIRPWLLQHPRAIGDAAVADLVARAEHPTTWGLTAAALAEASRQALRFERLQREVASAAARRRRLTVVAVSAAMVIVGAIGVEATLLAGTPGIGG